MEDTIPGLEILAFCRNLSAKEAEALPFKKQIFSGIENQWLVNQFYALKAAKQKIPGWWENLEIIYPDKLSVEQATSEWIARWKAGLIPEDCKLVIDGTAGLGLDSYFLGSKSEKLIAFELQNDKAKLLEFNLEKLGLQNFEVFTNDFEMALEELEIPFPEKTIVYIDPDRRPEIDKKILSWQASKPDLFAIYKTCMDRRLKLMVKLSPMDNPEELSQKMPGISKIWVVSLQQEVKEVLVCWNFDLKSEGFNYQVVEIQKSGWFHELNISRNKAQILRIEKPTKESYLYDPWPALRKGFKSPDWMIPAGFQTISPEAQLFTHTQLLEDSPCRVFQIVELILVFSEFIKLWKNKPLNVVSRNFPVSSDEMKKRNKWPDGGEYFLFCFQTLEKQNTYVLAKRVEPVYSEQFWKKLN